MPKLNFTLKNLQSLALPTAGRVEYWDESVGGSFGLRVSSTGKKIWVAMYRIGGRKRRFTIGDFERLPLGDARSLAKEILYRATKGEDAAAEKVHARKAESFSELAVEYIERHAKVNKRSWKADQRSLAADVLPHWGLIKASDIKRRDVIVLLDLHVARGAPVLANRVLALVRKIFNFGIERDIVEFNPCQAVRKPTREQAGQRVLTMTELKQFWSALDLSSHKEVAAILKLRILTAQRGVEIRLMRWAELDFATGWWTIPGERTKNKLDHRVPLSPFALEVIAHFDNNRGSSEFVFASTRRPNRAILNLKDPFAEIVEASEMEQRFVMRDLRRTATSQMTGQLQVPRFTVQKVLNHVEPGVTKVYDRHSYDQEKCDALFRWSEYLRGSLVAPAPSTNVFPLRMA